MAREARFMTGNEALAEAAIRCGIKHFYGYPITPSSEIPRYYAAQKDRGITFVQAETEVAAFNMVAGTAATGRRAMTATSGPGFSLGQEAMSFMAAAEVPGVIVDVQRPGPSDGDITGAQADYFQAVKCGGHGPYNTIVLAPYSVQEQADFIKLAAELAEKYLNPVVVLSDGWLAKLAETVLLPEETKYQIPSFPGATTGRHGREKGNLIWTYRTGPRGWIDHNWHMQRKFQEMTKNEQRWEEYQTDDAEIVVVAFGSLARIVEDVMQMARDNGIKMGMLRPISLWPFPQEAFDKLGDRQYMVAELNPGMMLQDVKLAIPDKTHTKQVNYLGGELPGPVQLYNDIVKQYGYEEWR